MSAIYTDLSHTLFPNAIDDEAGHPYMSDITSDASLLAVANQYNEAVASNDADTAAQILESNSNLQNCIFNADKYNWMRDAIIASQRYYMNDVELAIEQIAAHTVGIDDTNEYNSPNTNSYSITKIHSLIDGSDNQTTLVAGTWSGSSAPFTYTVSVQGVTANNNVDVSLSSSATVAQAKMWAKAMVLNATQTTNSITLKAYGKKPTANIPIVVTVHA